MLSKNSYALLIIDMQNDFVFPGAKMQVPNALETVPNIKRVLQACRQKAIPVFHVIREYSRDGLDVEKCGREKFLQVGGVALLGTKGAEIVDELRPIAGERTIVKKRWSAFQGTDLRMRLFDLEINALVIAGANLPNCPRCTAYDAAAEFDKVLLLTDGTSSSVQEVQESNLQDLRNLGVILLSCDQFLSELQK